jgi:glutamate-1-semialdehyde 2,1-aminomutase
MSDRARTANTSALEERLPPFLRPRDITCQTQTPTAPGARCHSNPVASVAGLASLAELRKPGVYERVRTIGGALMRGLTDLTKKLGITAQGVGHPTVFDIFFTDTPIVDWGSTLTSDAPKLKRSNDACLRRGILKGASKIYVSCAHTEQDVDRTLAVFREALTA